MGLAGLSDCFLMRIKPFKDQATGSSGNIKATAKEGGWSKFLQSPRNADHGRPAVGYDKDSIQIKPLYIPARAPGFLSFLSDNMASKPQ